jgi:DNA mismatch repair protein MSH5
MKRLYHNLESILSEVAAELSKSLPSVISHSLNVIYFPQLGYLITLENEGQEDLSNHELHLQFVLLN